MAEEIAAEVWRYAPDDVTGTRLLVLVRLANSAASDSRMVCISIVTLVKETRSKKTAVYDALSWLYGKGIIQEVDPRAVPQWGQPYKSVTRRITEVKDWFEGCPAPVFVPPHTDPQDLQFRIPETGKEDIAEDSTAIFPESGPYKSSSLTEKKKITTKAMTTSYGAAEPLRPETRSFRQRNLGREEDDLDPAKSLFPEDHQQPATRSGSREPGPDTGMGLATHFSRELSKTGTWKFPDLANRKSLARSFNTWMKSGITADEIRSMINIYCTRPDFRNPKKLPWVDFLAQRVLLGAELNAEALRDRHRPENYNPEEWTSQRGSGDGSDINNPRDDGTYEFDFEEWKKGK